MAGKFCAKTRGQAAPATYLAIRPQFLQRRVTWDMGGGGDCPGSLSMDPEHDGQLNGVPWRSLLMSEIAWAGL